MEDQIEELKLAFDMFDEQQQGFLTKQDLKSCVEKYGNQRRNFFSHQTGVKVSSKQIDEMFKEADVTGNGKIGFPEFMNMMARKMKQVL
jgi:calmodulin